MSIKALPTASLAQADQMRYNYRAKVPEDTTIEALMSDSFWAHVANRLQFGTKIEVIAIEGTWYQEFLVANVGSNWARVVPIIDRVEMIQGVPNESVPAGYEITHRGPELKYVLDRLSDNKRLKTGFNSKSEAIAWLQNHLKVPTKAA